MAKVYSTSIIIWFIIIILFNFIDCNNFDNSVKFRNKRQASTDVTTEYKNIPAAISSNSNNNNSNNNNSPALQHASAYLPSNSPSTLSSLLDLPSGENKNVKDVKQEPPGTNDSGGSSSSSSSSLSSSSSSSTTETSINIQSTIPSIIKNRPLLGVNGTGQRKDYPPSIQQQQLLQQQQQQQQNNMSSLTFSPAAPPIKKLSTPKKVIIDQKPVQNEEFIENIDKSFNETKEELEKNNITSIHEDYHLYYNSSTVFDPSITKKYWDTFKNITPNNMLSKSHRRAMTVQLSFEFPFYGNPVRNVTVATGGFLYTGEYVHSWLAATQYIAPLMANFDTSLLNNSYVKYADNGTAFTVVWENVALQDKPDVGTFTFSATLHNNGDIVFMYFSVPISIESIQDDKHPVKVGLSDAYIIDKVIFFARRKTIYEYHRVNFANQSIKNSTAIYLFALPTCLTLTDCHACLTQNINFNCTWCPILNKCSTGTDRRRQDWLHKGCDRAQITDASVCPPIGEKGNNAAGQNNDNDTLNNGTSWTLSSVEHNDSSMEHLLIQDKSVIRSYDKASLDSLSAASSSSKQQEQQDTSRVGLVLGLMLPICFVMSALVWVLYAYRNPHTKSGQLLIQYRPSQWTWRRGEARYTAATIHM